MQHATQNLPESRVAHPQWLYHFRKTHLAFYQHERSIVASLRHVTRTIVPRLRPFRAFVPVVVPTRMVLDL